MKGNWISLILLALTGFAGAPEVWAEVSSNETSIAAPDSAKETRKINRVEINGVTHFPQTDLESVLEIGPGDLVDRGKVGRTAENISTLYKNHGYEGVRIGARIRPENKNGQLEYILEFKVDEGKPTLMAQIKLTPVQVNDEVVLRYWNRLKDDLQAKMALTPGMPFDEDKIGNAKRTLQESLTSNEFIGAKIEDIRVTDAEEPAFAKESPTKIEAARWVNVEIRADLGDRVTFGFQGNLAVTQNRLIAIIEEQRVAGLGRDYVEVIRARIEDEYHSIGYAHVVVAPYVFERSEQRERHVTYRIEEGARAEIDQLHFDGNRAFTSKELTDQFYKKASDIVAHHYYVEKDVQKAAELVLEWIKSKGYLSAKLLTINRDYAFHGSKADAGRFVNLSIYIYEGEQTSVRNVTFDGARALTPEQIKEILGVAEGEPLNLFSFSTGIETLKSRYRALGYLSVKIENEGSDKVITYSDENRAADVHLQISEGPQFKVESIEIEGLTQTKEFVVRREILFRVGEVLEESQLTGTEAKLHRLGIFSNVTIHTLDDPEHPDQKIVRISLQEGTPGVIGGGVGLRNDLGVRVFEQAAYQNLLGENHTISFNAAANRRFQDYHFVEYEAQLAYIWPYFIFGETAFRPSLTLTGTEYFNFDAVTAALALTLERKFFKDLTFDFTYSLERIIQFNAQTDTDNQGIRIGSLIPALTWDKRNSQLSPSAGYLVTGSFELAEPWLGSQQAPFPIGYTRLLFRTDYYWPVINDIDWYFSFRTGYERSLESPQSLASAGDPSGAIPLIKQFALGGIGSLRGIQEQSLNLRNLNIRGSASYVNYRTQIDFPFAGSLKVGPFLDVANLLQDSYSFYRDRLYSPGFSFRYQTPVGPVNLDFAFPINPPPGIDTQQFFFSIGVI